VSFVIHADLWAHTHARSFGFTEDGAPRYWGFRWKGDLLKVYYVCFDGTVLLYTAPACMQLKMPLPSGGFVAMTVCAAALLLLELQLSSRARAPSQGHGSGAGKSDYFHEVFAREGSASSGLIVDRCAALAAESQVCTLLAAVQRLSRMPQQSSSGGMMPRPLFAIPLSLLVDLKEHVFSTLGPDTRRRAPPNTRVPTLPTASDNVRHPQTPVWSISIPKSSTSGLRATSSR
jgi:hypothetical protein